MYTKENNPEAFFDNEKNDPQPRPSWNDVSSAYGQVDYSNTAQEALSTIGGLLRKIISLIHVPAVQVLH
jgi:hypothetical protein